MPTALAADASPAMAADGAIEIHGRYATLRISDSQLRAYVNDQLSLDEDMGSRGAVGVRPVNLATSLLRTTLLTTALEFDTTTANLIEHKLWHLVRPQLPT